MEVALGALASDLITMNVTQACLGTHSPPLETQATRLAHLGGPNAAGWGKDGCWR